MATNDARIYNIDEVCNALKLKPPVLRKYSALLEDAGYTGIGRNSNNTRYYTDDNLRVLRELIGHKESGHMTLADAAKMIATRESGIDVMDDMTPALSQQAYVEQQAEMKKLTDAFLALTDHMRESERLHNEKMNVLLDRLNAVESELREMKDSQALLITSNEELKENLKERKHRSLLQKFFGVKD